MRGLSNLALALNHAGQPTKALAVCDRLEKECHDLSSAEAHRASAFLLLGRWAKALAAARYNNRLSPCESLLMAFAEYELGQVDEADACLLHAALNAPHTVAVVLGARVAAPSTGAEARDHNYGVTLQHTRRGYLVKRGAAARKHLAARFRSELFTRLRDELGAVERRWHENRGTQDRTDYDRMHVMQSPEFARMALGLLPEEMPAPVGATTLARRPMPRPVGRVVLFALAGLPTLKPGRLPQSRCVGNRPDCRPL